MPIVRFKNAASSVVLGKQLFSPPDFGSQCVCCGVDARGCTSSYDATSDHVSVSTLVLPVCQGCHEHALMPGGKITDQLWLLVAGIGAAAVGFSRFHVAQFFAVLFACGLGAAAASVLWFALSHRKKRRLALGGHYAGLTLSLDMGYPIVRTDSAELAARLLARNPGAERQLYRSEKRAFPSATARDAQSDKSSP